MTLLEPQKQADRHTPPADSSRPLRDALGHFATGVTVVSTMEEGGTPVGLTVNSFTSVSLRPPLVLWCLNRASANKAAFLRSGHYAVNILSKRQTRLAQRFASDVPDRFSGVPWRVGVAGQPLLDDVSAWLVCRLQGAPMPAGDHLVMFGKVLAHRVEAAEPLIFAHGRYRDLTTAAQPAR